MQPPSLEPWIVDRLRAERAFSRKLLRSAKKRPELRTSSPFEDKVTNTDESLEFALNLACDGNPRQVFSEMGYDYDAVSFGRPVQRLSLRTQLLDALLERYPASPTEEEDSQTAARQPTRVPANGRPAHLKIDAFISHASEDKKDIVRPLVEELVQLGCRVWYDEFDLRVGDGLRRTIDHHLTQSTFGIVILSPSFFAKNWPQYELDGLLAKEMKGKKVILPVWHKLTAAQVFSYSPSLAEKVALSTATLSIRGIAEKLAKVLKDARGT